MSRPNWTVPPVIDKETIKKMLRATWDGMHKTAAWFDLVCQLPQEQKQQLHGSQIRYQVDNLICGDCVPHAQKYIQENPPEDEIPSIWTWRFHNAVNRRLGKPEMNWDTYKDIYLIQKPRVCSASCGD